MGGSARQVKWKRRQGLKAKIQLSEVSHGQGDIVGLSLDPEAPACCQRTKMGVLGGWMLRRA